MNQEVITKTLREVRELRGMSLRELSRASGVALSGLQELETGNTGADKRPRLAQLNVVRRLSLALDINPFLVTELSAALDARCTSKPREDTVTG